MRTTRTLILVSLLGIVASAVVRCGGASRAGSRQTASTHPMQYYVSLPRGWSKTRRYPVVVAVAGVAKNWREHLEVFAAVRDARRYPFILVSPVVLTNGGGASLPQSSKYAYDSSAWSLAARVGRCAFDLEGIRAVVADVQEKYGGEAKYFITGFSGGGSIAEAATFLHPESLRGAAFAAANYRGRCITSPTEAPGDILVPQVISSDTSRAALPVRFFNGANDEASPLLLSQRDEAMRVAKEHGFSDVAAVIVPQTPHDPMAGQVLGFFATLLLPDER